MSKFARFLGNAPLVGDETQEEYDAFRAAIVSDLSEPDGINELYLKDVVDLSWQIRRERLIQTDVVRIYQKEVVLSLLKTTHSNPEKPFEQQDSVYRMIGAGPDAQLWLRDPSARKLIDAELERRGYSPRSVVALAYLEGRIEIDAFKDRIALYEARRRMVLNEIEHRNEYAAEQLKRATSRIIEGDFKQAAE